MHNPSDANVGQAVRAAQQAGLPRLEAQLLVLHALGRAPHDRAWLLVHDYDAMEESAWLRVRAGIARRVQGEPMAYITGHKEFYGLPLSIDNRVLDPRDDTETLVDWALELLPAETPQRIIDLGTGSGAIALALQQARPQWQVHASDRSTDALAVAANNAAHLRLPLQLRQANWLDGVTEKFAAIVSNPPYIADGDAHLPALIHEPLQALVSGADGLDDIRRIVQQAPACLESGGWLLLEHGYDQAEAVRALLHAAGFTQVQSRRDLADIERCSGARWTHPDAATTFLTPNP
jgi:release factor glutamine methyltransferase